MEAECRRVDITTGGHRVVYVPREIAVELDLHMLDRVEVINATDPERSEMASVQHWKDPDRFIGLCTELADGLGIDDRGKVLFRAVGKPISVAHIVQRMNGLELSTEQMRTVIGDVSTDSLSEVELSCFITSATIKDLSMSELQDITMALARSGEMLDWDDPMVADKHCTGGVPGNRTSPIVVSIISSLGVKIPKASSRAITSPAGTADVMESFCNVAFTREEIVDIVKRANGCLIWGGGLNIAPADSRLIRIRKMIDSNPEGLLISSILSKKYAMGSRYLLVDMPVGLETRYHSLGEVRHMAQKVMKVASRLGMKAEVEITFGDEPIGNGIGPYLEARDVLKVLKGELDAPRDLREKAVRIAGKLVDLFGPDLYGRDHRPGDGIAIAGEVLSSGKAFSSFERMVEAQGGKGELDPSSFKGSDIVFSLEAPATGQIVDIDNRVIAKTARLAGAPSNKSSGLDILVRTGQMVRKKDTLMLVHAGSKSRMELAREHLRKNRAFTINV